MRLYSLQIIAALAAAVCFVLAFMATGAVILSALFMVLGLGALGLLTYGLIRGILRRGRKGGHSARA